jgi:hypothetical protein
MHGMNTIKFVVYCHIDSNISYISIKMLIKYQSYSESKVRAVT